MSWWISIRWLVFMGLAALLCLPAHALEPPVVSEEMKETARRSANVAIPQDIKDRVQDIMKTMQSEEWKTRYNAMRNEAMRTVGIEPPPESSSSQPPPPGQTDRLYVFVSSSMPMETLRNYAASIEKIHGGVMVLRGFVGGARRVGPTATFASNVLRRDPHCTDAQCAMRGIDMQIDPVLYRRYGIVRVPAVVYEEHASPEGYCSVGIAEAAKPRAAEVVYGDASLRYAVETLYKKTKQPGLRRIEQELEKGV